MPAAPIPRDALELVLDAARGRPMPAPPPRRCCSRPSRSGWARDSWRAFSQATVAAVLNLPEHLSPEMLVCLGHPSPVQPPPMRPHAHVTWQALTSWNRFPDPPSSATRPGPKRAS
jgi:hypothetical protein